MTEKEIPPYMWENDPHSVPMTPERERAIQIMEFLIYKSTGELPKDPDEAKAYAEWFRRDCCQD